ncbi:hypothetical protein F5B19DRAFT_488857 [Rostrohypoxylon terebratum]|nr:hypothetical protein F5B19DRAFT_488857 [Rostrohypoxylon terebratum]
MVGFVERFRKPKLPIAPGSPSKDYILSSQQPITPQHSRPPVLRNFSYPINIGKPEPPPYPTVPPTGQTAWDRLGEICSFSPNRTGKVRTPTLDDPFFFKSGEEPYSRLDGDDDDENSFASKLSKGQSLGDRIFAQNPIVTSRLKRNSLGQHKAAVSLDTSRLLALPHSDPDRPASSSGVPLIDTKLRTPSPTSGPDPSSPFTSRENTFDFSTDLEEESLILKTTTSMKSLGIGPGHRVKPLLNSYAGSDINSLEDTDRIKRHDTVMESVRHKRSDGKQGWLSQFKGWVSVSEPSAHALKQYKKETYKKAQIALDDPKANAKLHLPIGTLPQGAIKPAGRGPDPEELVTKNTEQRKNTRVPGSRIGSTSQGSMSSMSRYSSSSSTVFSGGKENGSL